MVRLSEDFDIIRENIVREMAIHVTQQCNLNCKGCYAKPVNDALAQQLSIKDLRWINDTFHPEKTVLLGGEPLLYDNLAEALSLFKNMTISTNGYFIPKNIKLLQEYAVKQLQISMEGAETYNDAMRGKGSYERAIQAGKIAKDNNLNCYFRVGYCSKNLDEIVWLLDNISTKMEIPLALLPRIEEPAMDVDDQIWLFDKITSANNGSIIAMPHFWQYLGKHGRCNAGSERLNITYDKRITPCHLMWNYTLGEIGYPREVINQARMTFINAHKRIPVDCMYCPQADVCKGGCLITPTHMGCPLKRNFGIKAYMNMHGNTDTKAMKDKIETMTNLVKDSLIC